MGCELKEGAGMVMVTLGLPMFGGGAGQASQARLHLDHYHRLVAVLDAARTGNPRLIALAVAEQDKWGGRAERSA